MNDVPDLIGNDELLGRGVFSSSIAKRAQSSGVIHSRAFKERLGVADLSVDRLSYADKKELGTLHDLARNGVSFYGWASIRMEHAVCSGRQVAPDPLPSNKWHANIRLPTQGTTITEDEQQVQAVQLANLSEWVERI